LLPLLAETSRTTFLVTLVMPQAPTEKSVAPTAKIRLLIVDDSAFMREAIKALLETDPQIAVVGEAANGREAVAAVLELRPDIVTMDVEMPVMGGLEAIGEIMARRAVPILVITTLSDAQTAFQAIARGALDLMLKSDLRELDGLTFCRKIQLLASIKVITHMRGNGSHHQLPASAAVPRAPLHFNPCQVFAIAASTGGPAALAFILARLPADFPVPILIAQHIAAGFAPGMVAWLNGLCPLKVKLACAGDRPAPGMVLIAPSECHMSVDSERRILFTDSAATDIYHPCCDLLLTSVAKVYGKDATGLILTGMGSDGAAGMHKIYAAGGFTLAEDQSTSVIFGMNQVAINAGSVRKVLPLQEIAAAMCRLAGMGA
jgi:two-component system chemotaxis response regulator CheB